MVLKTKDISKDNNPLAFLDKSIAIPATGAFIGTPASISARVPPHTVAIEEEPLDSRMSETILTDKGIQFWEA